LLTRFLAQKDVVLSADFARVELSGTYAPVAGHGRLSDDISFAAMRVYSRFALDCLLNNDPRSCADPAQVRAIVDAIVDIMARDGTLLSQSQFCPVKKMSATRCCAVYLIEPSLSGRWLSKKRRGQSRLQSQKISHNVADTLSRVPGVCFRERRLAPRALVHRIVRSGFGWRPSPRGGRQVRMAGEVEGAGLRAIARRQANSKTCHPGGEDQTARLPQLAAQPPKHAQANCCSTVQEEARRTLLRRHQIVGALRKVRQRINSLLMYLGVAESAGLAHWSMASVTALEFLPLEPDAREIMTSHLRTLFFFQKELKAVEARLGQSLEQEHQK
jgi:hypothetical protein